MSVGIGDDLSLHGEGHVERAIREREERDLNGEMDRLIRHLSRHPDDYPARAKLLETQERLGVAVRQ